MILREVHVRKCESIQDSSQILVEATFDLDGDILAVEDVVATLLETPLGL